jgi:hypothetical protein
MFTSKYCIPSSWFEIAKIIISVGTLIFAAIELNKWRTQLKGTHQFEVYKKLLVLLGNIAGEVKDFSWWINMIYCEKIPDDALKELIESLSLKQEHFSSLVDEFQNFTFKYSYWLNEFSVSVGEILRLVIDFRGYCIVLFSSHGSGKFQQEGRIEIVDEQKNRAKEINDKITILSKKMDRVI